MSYMNSTRCHPSPIAVIGMSCRFPWANSPQEFWEFLLSGQNGISDYPSNRPIPNWDHSFPKAGYLKCPIDEFDANFFAISPREASEMSPQQRILLQVAWESLESAGIPPDQLRGSRTGVFIGTWQSAYERTVLPPSTNFLKYYLGNSLNGTAARLSYVFDFRGPNVAVESGCSSSLAAIHLACESLRYGNCSIALAGGVNILIEPWHNNSCPFLSPGPEPACKMFDVGADGYARAEGCGIIVLKPLEMALKDGDTILGTILGSDMNNDGGGAGSFGTPSSGGQRDVIRGALLKAGVEAKDVCYVEAHGTGTSVGDPVEFEALAASYGSGREIPLLIGSCKSNIGHSESAAGVAGAIKVLLALQHKQIPPNLHFHTLNPKIELDCIPCQVPVKITPLNSSGERGLIAGLNSFALGGNNVHMIFQEYRNSSLAVHSNANSIHRNIITLSAKSEAALFELRHRYVEFLRDQVNVDVGRFSYTTTIGRSHHRQFRGAVVADSITDLILGLSEAGNFKSNIDISNTRVGFLFPGQGCQYDSMAAGLLCSDQTEFPEFHSAFAECDEIFRGWTGISLRVVLEDLHEHSIYCQPAIFAVQYCLVKLWASFGIWPDFVLGHSAGEFAAAACAGVLSLTDAMDLVIQRSILISGVEAGLMLVVSSTLEGVRVLVQQWESLQMKDSWLDIAAINSDSQVVVAGRVEDVTSFQEFCDNIIPTKILTSTTAAFHSRAMDPILEAWSKVTSKIRCKDPKCTYVSSVTGQRMTAASEFNSNYWGNHLRSPVQFKKALEFVQAAETGNNTLLIEIGPRSILLPFAAKVGLGYLRLPSLKGGTEDRVSFLSTLRLLYLAGMEVKWEGLGCAQGQRTKIQIPFYHWDSCRYWGGSVDSAPSSHPMLWTCHAEGNLVDKVFLCSSSLESVEGLKWVGEHRIGNSVLVPAALFLDTIASAGRHCSNKEMALVVKNFSILKALELNAKKEEGDQIQIVVEDGDIKRIRIFSKIEDKWVKHAQGEFSQTPHPKPKMNFDVGALMNSEALEAHNDVASIYALLSSEHGYNFGPSFRIIQSIRTKGDEALAQILLSGGNFETKISYVCHPLVLDAMLQTLIFHWVLHPEAASQHGVPPLQRGQVVIPVGVKKFVWRGGDRPLGGILYCHMTFNARAGGASLTLYSQSGVALATLEGVDWIVANPGSLSQTKAMPDFYHTVWQLMDGHEPSIRSEVRIVLDSLKTPNVRNSSELCQRLTAANEVSLIYMIKSIQELGWKWVIGQPIVPSNLPPKMAGNGYSKFLRAIIGFLEEEGYCLDGSALKPLHSLQICKDLIQEHFSGPPDVFMEFVHRCGSNMTSFLRGEQDDKSQLLENESGVAQLYMEWPLYQEYLDLFRVQFAEAVLGLQEREGTMPRCLKILEVGAGTGSAASVILSTLEHMDIKNYSYTFTDISPYFLRKAELNHAQNTKFKYQVFDIERDPLSQGLQPYSFHFILGFQVVHATKDLSRSLSNLRMLLSPDSGSCLLLGEFFRPVPSVTLIFGMLEGWWRFQDEYRSGFSPIANKTGWECALKTSGFQDIKTGCILEDEIGAGYVIASGQSGYIVPKCVPPKLWLLLDSMNEDLQDLVSGLETFGRSATSLNQKSHSTPDDFLQIFSTHEIEGVIIYTDTSSSATTSVDDVVEEQRQTCGRVLSLCQALSSYFENKRDKPRLVVLSRGLHYIPPVSESETMTHLNPTSATVWGLLKVFVNENPSYKLRLIDVEPMTLRRPEAKGPHSSQGEPNQILSQLWGSDSVSVLAIRQGLLYTQVLSKMTKSTDPLHIPLGGHFTCVNPASGSLSNVYFAEKVKESLESKEVEVEMWAVGLNFRDVLAILKPDGLKGSVSDAPLGMDISGIVVAGGTKFKMGDRVFGISGKGTGLASSVVMSEESLLLIPKQMSFVQAAALPTAFLTAYLALLKYGEMNCKDRILIHTASGGFGLAAVQAAQRIGAEIYATAGSLRKREYLRSLGIRYIYSSRDTSFGSGIMRDSLEKGVTLILNTLTSQGFKEASLEACAPGARFIELSKLNVWTEGQVLELRPDVKYTILDILALRSEWTSGLTEALRTLPSDWYTKYPITVFNFHRIRQALAYLRDGKQIGKICLRLPKFEIGSQLPSFDYFEGESSYLISGGLGGIGLEVAKWMTSSGARHLVLVSRNPPNQSDQLEILKSLRENGTEILIFQADVGDYIECRNILENIKHLPPLRGIWHAAGVLADATIPNQSWTKFDKVFRAKVYGAWYLHSLTQHLALDHFVLFSSISSILGPPGQSNHAAANYYLDALAQFRWSRGLSATILNWGPWAEVGILSKGGRTYELAEQIVPFSPAQGIAALERVFEVGMKEAAILDVPDWSGLQGQWPVIRALLSSQNPNDQRAKIKMSPTKLKHKVPVHVDKDGPNFEETLENHLEGVLRSVLGMSGQERIPRDQDFTTLGLDSLMRMELRNYLQEVLPLQSLGLSGLQAHSTLRSLTFHIGHLLRSAGPEPNLHESSHHQSKQVEIYKLDSILPVEIRPPPLAKYTRTFQTILLTGSTGFLGSHFLAHLTSSFPTLRIYCLIRSKNKIDALDKLQKALGVEGLSESTNLDNVHVLPGDLVLDKFGLAMTDYDTLVRETDLVIHCAAKVNHVEDYCTTAGNDFRSQNVFALLTILRFVVGGGKLKLLHFASSVLVNGANGDSHTLSEDYPDPDDYGQNMKIHAMMGYPISKLICEKLIAQAEGRGIPILTVRYPLLIQRSGTKEVDKSRPDSDHFWSLILSFVSTKMVPILADWWPIMSVDSAVLITNAILFNPESELGLYNFSPRNVLTNKDLREILVEGLNLRDAAIVPYSEWRNAVWRDGRLYGSEPIPLAAFEQFYSPENTESVFQYVALIQGGSNGFGKTSEKLTRNVQGVSELGLGFKWKEILQRQLQAHLCIK